MVKKISRGKNTGGWQETVDAELRWLKEFSRVGMEKECD